MNKLINRVIIILLACILLILSTKYYPAYFQDDKTKLTFFISLLALFSLLARVTTSSVKWSLFFKQMCVWIFIIFSIFTAYSFQYELKGFSDRIIATIVPGYGQIHADGSVTYYAGNNKHFTIGGLINSSCKVQFLFDTGASMVSLTAADAKLIGLDISALNYNFPLNTANGISYGARVILAKVQIGPIIVNNVEAIVSQEGASDVSLLGMSFLGRIKQFVIKGNTLTLVN